MKRTHAKHDSLDCGLLKDVEFRIATLNDTEGLFYFSLS